MQLLCDGLSRTYAPEVRTTQGVDNELLRNGIISLTLYTCEVREVILPANRNSDRHCQTAARTRR
jgi:hypothetical protein